MVEELSTEFPGIKTFATLSPIPGFCTWLRRIVVEGEMLPPVGPVERILSSLDDKTGDAREALKQVLDNPSWHEDPDRVATLKNPLMRLCAHYLTQEKRTSTTALDPVAHFHLSNGARMESLNWLGDQSEKGYAQSAGMMINYLYKMDRIEDNHEGYTSVGTVACSSSIRGLLKS